MPLNVVPSNNAVAKKLPFFTIDLQSLPQCDSSITQNVLTQ
jgi:hypothetical protein